MPTVNIHAAKTQLSRLVDGAAAGEEVIIARAGRPVARLVPLESQNSGQPSDGLACSMDRSRSRPTSMRRCQTICWTRLKGADAGFARYANVLLWAIGSSAKLDQTTRCALEEAGNDVLFSAASIWEITIKAGLRRADFNVRPNVIAEAARRMGFDELPVCAGAAMLVADLPLYHRDPFDRLLIAQAIAEPARFYTADPALARYSELVTLVAERRA